MNNHENKKRYTKPKLFYKGKYEIWLYDSDYTLVGQFKNTGEVINFLETRKDSVLRALRKIRIGKSKYIKDKNSNKYEVYFHVHKF